MDLPTPQPANKFRISVLRGRQEASAPHLARTEVRLYFHVVAICCPVTGASGVPGNPGKHCFGQWLEFAAKELRQWLAKLGTGTLYIEPEVHERTVTAMV